MFSERVFSLISLGSRTCRGPTRAVRAGCQTKSDWPPLTDYYTAPLPGLIRMTVLDRPHPSYKLGLRITVDGVMPRISIVHPGSIADKAGLRIGPRREPFDSTPMAVDSASPGSPHVRPTGVHRTCGEPDETKENTHPKNCTALLRDQATGCCRRARRATRRASSSWGARRQATQRTAPTCAA